MITQYKPLLDNISTFELKFVTTQFKIYISKAVTDLFPNMNSIDTKILLDLTIFIVDLISFKYHFKDESIYYEQWTQNNYRDIKGVILLLLPFMDDRDNNFLYNKMSDLNQFLYSKITNTIPNNIKNDKREKILSSHFTYGNMGIGLLPFKIRQETSSLLNLYENSEKLIYKIIYHNFIGLLQTLEIINGKSYINWLNIVPLNLNNYIDSDIFKSTENRLKLLETKLDNPNKIAELLSDNILDYNGLWFGDFYNIIRIRYYEDAKKIKWLFFPYDFKTPKYMEPIYLIQGLNKMLDIDMIMNSTTNRFNDMSNIEKIYFESKIKEVITYINSGLDSVDEQIIKYFLINLINNSSDNIKNIMNNKFTINEEDEDYENNDFTDKAYSKIDRITKSNLLECMVYLSKNNLDSIWNYLKDSIILLKLSAYGKFLIKDNMISSVYYYESFNKNIKSKLNLKNIYNIAKSLSHDRDWVLLDKNYISFNNDNKIEYFNKLCKTNDWLQLTGNLNRQYNNNLTPTTVNTLRDEILDAFRIFKINIIFEELVTMGILSKFEPSTKSYNNNLENKFKTNISDYNESYYYLTNDKYKNMSKIRVEKKPMIDMNDKYKELPYFDYMIKKTKWYNFYALNWISQISFFKHYIYNMVIYVTGGTGVGKSTQVPKLLLYALKAIDYKTSDGKIICSQPRQAPTKNNATRIAIELGVPIEEPTNNNIMKVTVNNMYVQYKHKDNSHTFSNNICNSLTLVTDGVLFNELIKNPTLKKEVNNILINSNVYDIVIVDEAHEHNINMDLIITMMKQACYINNMVRLVIVSATMADDEPIYRRYFYNINDNLLFPIKYSIINKRLGLNEPFLPETKFMDRRYHISPPGIATQYVIKEEYLKKDPFENMNITLKEKSNIAQQLAYKRIEQICQESTVGDILLFANGENEILEAVEELNMIIPAGNIALPYFSKLHSNYKNIIEEIGSKIYSIKNKRENIHLEWGAKFIQDNSVNNNIYKRAIIVATNVAEASITIDSLKYVIDNGYAKVNKYNETTNLTNLEIEEISESSRIQRKGRIGRVSDGTIYYMYKENAKKDIKPKYKITQDNIYITLLELISNKNMNDNMQDFKNKKKLIIHKDYNPNFNALNRDPNDEYTYAVTSGLYKLWATNYYINNNPLDKKYYSTYPYMESSFMRFYSGQIISNIMDREGFFYLIHPYEDSLERNILNNIINVNNNKLNIIPIDKFFYMFTYLIDRNLLIDSNANKLIRRGCDLNECNFIKTELVEDILKLISDNLESTDSVITNTMTLIAASNMGCFMEVNDILVLLLLIDYSLPNIINENIKWDEYKKKYMDSKITSDIIFLHNIIIKLKKSFANLFNINNNSIKEYADKTLNKFKLYKEPPKDFDITIWNKLTMLKNRGELTTKYQDELKKDTNVETILYSNLEKYKNDIIEWCDNNYLNSNIIMIFIKKLIKNKIKDKNNNKLSEKLIINFTKQLTDYTIEEKILRSFIYGNPQQYTYRLEPNKSFMTYINRHYNKITFAKPNSISKSKTSETITDLTGELTFYLKYSIEDDILNINILNNINIRWLLAASPLTINPLIVPDIVRTTNLNDNIMTIEYASSYYIQTLIKEINNNWNQSYNIWDSDDTPILRAYYKSLLKLISNK